MCVTRLEEQLNISAEVLHFSFFFVSHSPYFKLVMANVCVSCPAPRAPPRRRRSYARRAPARRRARARRPVRRRRSYVRRSLMRKRGFTKYEMAQVNPFDPKVEGVKIPDSNTQPSTTSYGEDRVVFTGSATDMAQCKAFMPNPSAIVVQSVDSSSSAWTWPASFAANTSQVRSSFVTNYVGIRPVAHGIRISSQAAPTSVTGFVHIAIYPVGQFNQSTWNFPTSLGQMTQLPWYRRVTVSSLTQTPLIVVNKFLDCTATRYFDPLSDLSATGTDTGFQFSGSWCAILVAVEGQPLLTSNLSVETLVHYECLPSFGSSFGIGTSPAAPFNVEELQETSRINGQTEASFYERDDSLRSRIVEAAQAAQSGAYQAASDFFDAYVLPGARYAGYAAANAAGLAAAGRAYQGGIPGVNTPRLMQY